MNAFLINDIKKSFSGKYIFKFQLIVFSVCQQKNLHIYIKYFIIQNKLSVSFPAEIYFSDMHLLNNHFPFHEVPCTQKQYNTSRFICQLWYSCDRFPALYTEIYF